MHKRDPMPSLLPERERTQPGTLERCEGEERGVEERHRREEEGALPEERGVGTSREQDADEGVAERGEGGGEGEDVG